MIEDMHHAHDQARPVRTGIHEPASTTEQRFALGTWLRSPRGLVALGFLAVAGFYRKEVAGASGVLS